MGVKVEENEEQIFIPRTRKYEAVDVKTLVYPGFPTDLQQPFFRINDTSNWDIGIYGYHLFSPI